MVTFVEISKIYDTISIVVTFFSLVARWHCLRSNSCTIRICHIWSSFFTIFKVSFYRNRLNIVVCSGTTVTTATTHCKSSTVSHISCCTVKYCTAIFGCCSNRVSTCCNIWLNTCCCRRSFSCCCFFSYWSGCC